MSTVASSTRNTSASPMAEPGGDAVAVLAGPDRDRDPALGRDPAVGQQRPEVGDGTPAHVNGERRGKQAGQERHGPPSLR